ncbi:hypothetical protein PG997_001643 [Apiospora hydei]|uniref:Uncharacterized protein n=1 Tax=Apiospora hydei TaxID=1337664 RepID=A0ABR1XE50_9PEZI
MHFSSILVLAAPLAALAATLEAPIPGYRIVPLEWEVEMAPGRTEALNGTIEEVYAQILRINPDFQLAAPAPAAEARGLQPEKRNQVVCGAFSRASRRHIRKGIMYLHEVAGRPANGPGPRACGQDDVSKELESFDKIAFSAMKILQGCASVRARSQA